VAAAVPNRSMHSYNVARHDFVTVPGLDHFVRGLVAWNRFCCRQHCEKAKSCNRDQHDVRTTAHHVADESLPIRSSEEERHSNYTSTNFEGEQVIA